MDANETRDALRLLTDLLPSVAERMSALLAEETAAKAGGRGLPAALRGAPGRSRGPAWPAWRPCSWTCARRRPSEADRLERWEDPTPDLHDPALAFEEKAALLLAPFARAQARHVAVLRDGFNGHREERLLDRGQRMSATRAQAREGRRRPAARLGSDGGAGRADLQGVVEASRAALGHDLERVGADLEAQQATTARDVEEMRRDLEGYDSVFVSRLDRVREVDPAGRRDPARRHARAHGGASGPAGALHRARWPRPCARLEEQTREAGAERRGRAREALVPLFDNLEERLPPAPARARAGARGRATWSASPSREERDRSRSGLRAGAGGDERALRHHRGRPCALRRPARLAGDRGRAPGVGLGACCASAPSISSSRRPARRSCSRPGSRASQQALSSRAWRDAARCSTRSRPRSQATHGGFEEMAARVDALETETARVVEQADEAEAALQARLEEVETDLSAAPGRRRRPAALGAAAELKEFEQRDRERDRPPGRLLRGRVPAGARAKSQELYEVLVQADEDVRDGAGIRGHQVCEESSERALRECAASYDAELGQIGRLGDSMEDLLKDLRDFVDDGRERLEDRQERWEDRAKDTRESLRDALDKLKELQDHLARHGFH